MNFYSVSVSSFGTEADAQCCGSCDSVSDCVFQGRSVVLHRDKPVLQLAVGR